MSSNSQFIENNLKQASVPEKLPEKGSNIYFIGICGSSMSGLAVMLKAFGYNVCGSDRSEGPSALSLKSSGIPVNIGQKAENIGDDIDLAIYTVAVGEDNPEVKEVRRRKIPLIERGKFLGMLSRAYRYCISVAGTHGKTTTTAMLGSIMIAAGIDPAIHLGGTFPLIGGSVRPSTGDYLITEACEYYRHMLELSSFGAILLNVESEHLDYYKTDANIDAAFSEFASSVSPDGFMVVCAQNKRAMDASRSCRAKVVSYALREDMLSAEFEAGNITSRGDHTNFTLFHNGIPRAELCVNVPGRHNVLNATAAAAAAWYLGAGQESIKEGLSAFTGTGRRFEKKGMVRGALLIDDYAHHPTEVKATLSAARDTIGKEGRIIAIFQVHTFTRAKDFPDWFADSLKEADKIIVSDIYAAREKDPGDVSGATLAELFTSKGLDAVYISSFEKIAEHVSSMIRQNDLVITLGAGDINKVLPMIR